jgi:hypothetical protein
LGLQLDRPEGNKQTVRQSLTALNSSVNNFLCRPPALPNRPHPNFSFTGFSRKLTIINEKSRQN